MTEKEVIKRIHDLIHTCDVGIEKHDTYDDLFKLDKLALTTAVNLLEKKDKEIKKISEIYEQLHKTHIQTRRSLKGIINKQNKEIQELKEEINYWKECAEGEAGLRKQIQEDYQEQMQELLESEE